MPLTLCMLGRFSIFFTDRCLLFSISSSSKHSFRNTIRVSNNLDVDEAQCFVEADLGPNF